MALRSVREDGYGEQIVSDRPLAVGKDRSRRDGKLVITAFAFPHWPCRQLASIEATAARAIWLAAVVGPTDALKRDCGLIVRHARHGAQRERSGGCGEEEVL